MPFISKSLFASDDSLDSSRCGSINWVCMSHVEWHDPYVHSGQGDDAAASFAHDLHQLLHSMLRGSGRDHDGDDDDVVDVVVVVVFVVVVVVVGRHPHPHT